jgi:hypothetical protein
MAFVSKTNGVDDLIMLSDVSESGINANLKKRYAKDLIYTCVETRDRRREEKRREETGR